MDFRRVTTDDFPLLARWLEGPRVRRWWNHATTPEALEADFGPATRGEEPCEDWLALLDGRPVGLVQRYLLADYPEDREALAQYVDVPDGAAGIDYLVGEPEDQGKGLGPAIIRAATERLWEEFPDASCVLVPVVAANRASWRALEKAGFRRVGEGALEPDNPVDDPLHVISRLDRPRSFGLPTGSR